MKRNIFLVLALCLVMPIVCLLTACGTPSLTGIAVQYKDNTYLFDATTPLQITYSDSLSVFTKEDFVVTASYDNGTTGQVTDYEFSLLKVEQGSETVATSLLPGTYKVKVVYGDVTVSVSFVVNPISLLDTDVSCQMAETAPYVVGGKAEPDVSLALVSGGALVENVDYTLTYGDNNTVGENAGSVEVNFIGKYSGQVTYYFDITPLAIDEVVFNDVNTTYNGTDKRALCQIDVSGIIGVSDIEYSYYGGANFDQLISDEVKDVGTYKVVAHILVDDGYSPVADKEFTLTIDRADISSNSVESLGLDNIEVPFKNAPYTVSDFEETISQALENSGITYSLSMLEGESVDNLGASTQDKHGSLLITGDGNYSGNITISFSIMPADISTSGVLTINMNNGSYTYNGAEQTLREVHYTFTSPILLASGIDYSVQYADNIEAGTCHYTITGHGNYTGTYEGTFEIGRKSISLPSTTWHGEDNGTISLAYNGENRLSDVYLNGLDTYFSSSYVALQYNDDVQDYISASLVNVGQYRVRATIAFDDEAEDAYEHLYMDNYVIDGNVEKVVDVTITSVLATATLSGAQSFEYTGSSVAPQAQNIVVTAMLGGQERTLVKDVDYTLSFDSEAINVYCNSQKAIYYVTITDISGNFHYNMGTYTLVSYSIDPRPLIFNDTTGANATLSYPLVSRAIWSDVLGFNKMVENAYDTGLERQVAVEFSLVDGNKIHASTIAYSNFIVSPLVEDVVINESDISLYNPYFTSFKVNDVEMDNSQIESLTTAGLDLFDIVKFRLNPSYCMRVYTKLNGEIISQTGYASYSNTNESQFIAGKYSYNSVSTVATSNEMRIFNNTGEYWSYNTPHLTLDVPVDIDIFQSFTVGGDELDMSNGWSGLRNLSSIDYKDEITIEVKEGYQATISSRSASTIYHNLLQTDSDWLDNTMIAGENFEPQLVLRVKPINYSFELYYYFDVDYPSADTYYTFDEDGFVDVQVEEGGNFFKFTTDEASSSLVYMLVTDNINITYAVARKPSSTLYIGEKRNSAIVDSEYLYVAIDNYSPNTEYYLFVNSTQSNEDGETSSFQIMQYREEFVWDIDNKTFDDPYGEATVSKLCKQASIEEFIPQQLYRYNQRDYSIYHDYNTVVAIADYAFCDSHYSNNYASSMMYIMLPSTITSIGAHAFDGCSNLQRIIYDGTAEDWNDITFGEGVFNGCSSALAVMCNNKLYALSTDGTIVIPPQEEEEEEIVATLLLVGEDNEVNIEYGENNFKFNIETDGSYIITISGEYVDELLESFLLDSADYLEFDSLDNEFTCTPLLSTGEHYLLIDSFDLYEDIIINISPAG